MFCSTPTKVFSWHARCPWSSDGRFSPYQIGHPAFRNGTVGHASRNGQHLGPEGDGVNSFWNTVITKVPRPPLPITPRLIWSEGAAWTASTLPPASKKVLLFMTLPKLRFPVKLHNRTDCVSADLRGPVQMLPQKLERALVIDCVRPAEEFDCGGFRHLHLHIVKPARFGVLVRHPFVRRHTVVMSAFYQ
jgi:hypothetical protein